MNTNVNLKKLKPLYTIVIVIIAGLATFTLLGNYLASSGKLLKDKWDCGDSIILNLDKDNKFEMYSSTDKSFLNVSGTYKVKKEKQDGTTLKYTLDMSAKERTISNQKYDDEYNTQYEINMDSSKQDEIHMVNTESYNIYNCKKI